MTVCALAMQLLSVSMQKGNTEMFCRCMSGLALCWQLGIRSDPGRMFLIDCAELEHRSQLPLCAIQWTSLVAIYMHWQASWQSYTLV